MDLIEKLAVITELNQVANSNSKLYRALEDKIDKISRLRPIEAVPKAELEEMVAEIMDRFQEDLEERAKVYNDVLEIIRKYIDGEENS